MQSHHPPWKGVETISITLSELDINCAHGVYVCVFRRGGEMIFMSLSALDTYWAGLASLSPIS